MKFFIVDNGSRYLENIVLRISDGHEYRIQTYSPFETLDPQDADIIILSGGMQNEVADDLENGDPWYRHEFSLIQNSDKPILGICLGLQMITVALGGSLSQLPKLVDAEKHVQLTKDGHRYLGHQEPVVHEKHQWVVRSHTNTGLKVLAKSDDGIEMLYHPTRKIIGTQFHPEIDVNNSSKQLFWGLIDLIAQPAGVVNAKR